MGNVPKPHRSPKAPKDANWSWGRKAAAKMQALVDHGGWKAVATAHAWYDASADENDPPRKKTAYKLPHHDLVGGELKVVWRGVVQAMAVLNGARGGVDMPERDRKEVYRHLKAHYEQFDEDPPELS